MSVRAGRQEYERRHRTGPHARVDDLSDGALRYWATSRSLNREPRADLAAEYRARTDPTGSRARDRLQAELPSNLDRVHQRVRLRTGTPQP